ncbi:hypothetical protein PINS_up006626 [Pythium insidiosum]|nr:hypothetical protein PINS_up006626 [Pythium insidiosum]
MTTRGGSSSSGGGGGLHRLNDSNDDDRLDRLLRQYFRPASSSSARKATSNKRRREERSADDAEDPSTTLKGAQALKTTQRSRSGLGPILELSRELFARSAAFRSLVVAQTSVVFERLLEAAGERDVGSSKQRVTGTHSPDVVKVLELIEQWKTSFGARYPTLVAGYAWLEDRGYSFPRLQEREQVEALNQQAQQQHQHRVREIKRQQMEQEMARVVPEMEATIEEMERIFEILVPTLDAFRFEDEPKESIPSVAHGTDGSQKAKGEVDDVDAVEEDIEWENVQGIPMNGVENEQGDIDEDDDEDVEWEDVDNTTASASDNDDDSDSMQHMDINEIVQAYGLGSSSYQLTISIPTTVCERSSENEVLFRHLSDCVLQIRKRFLPLVSDWIDILSSTDTAQATSGLHQTTTELSTLRDRLQSATLKWEDLVKESERKRFASIRPSVVSLPVTAYDGKRAASLRPRRRRRRVVL